MSKELETVYVDFGDISAQATIERLVELVGIEAVKSAIDEIAAQQSFAPDVATELRLNDCEVDPEKLPGKYADE